MSEHNKARISAFIDRVLTAGEIDATGDYFHGDVVEEVPLPGQGPGLEGHTETLIRLRRAFPDMHWRVEEQMAEDTRVLTRFCWSGTRQGEFLGIPPTHRVVRVWGMVIDRFEGDTVTSTRLLMDTLSLLQQLGVVPSAPEAGGDLNTSR
jgi:predicted ester cyclase